MRFYSSSLSDSYLNHAIFDEIDNMCQYYEGLSNTCFSFIPTGTIGANTLGFGNYNTGIYSSLKCTLDSIKTLLKIGRINDSFILVRTYFDFVLTDIYIADKLKLYNEYLMNLSLEELKFEDLTNKDFNDWQKNELRIPTLKKLLNQIKNSPVTNDIYPIFDWDNSLKNIRQTLDDCVHGNKLSNLIYNCEDMFLLQREKKLDTLLDILKQIITIHIAFIFHMNAHYMNSSDLLDYLDEGLTPPEGSETWLAPYAQMAYDRYIKPHHDLDDFIRQNCTMKIE